VPNPSISTSPLNLAISWSRGKSNRNSGTTKLESYPFVYNERVDFDATYVRNYESGLFRKKSLRFAVLDANGKELAMAKWNLAKVLDGKNRDVDVTTNDVVQGFHQEMVNLPVVVNQEEFSLMCEMSCEVKSRDFVDNDADEDEDERMDVQHGATVDANPPQEHLQNGESLGVLVSPASDHHNHEQISPSNLSRKSSNPDLTSDGSTSSTKRRKRGIFGIFGRYRKKNSQKGSRENSELGATDSSMSLSPQPPFNDSEPQQPMEASMLFNESPAGQQNPQKEETSTTTNPTQIPSDLHDQDPSLLASKNPSLDIPPSITVTQTDSSSAASASTTLSKKERKRRAAEEKRKANEAKKQAKLEQKRARQEAKKAKKKKGKSPRAGTSDSSEGASAEQGHDTLHSPDQTTEFFADNDFYSQLSSETPKDPSSPQHPTPEQKVRQTDIVVRTGPHEPKTIEESDVFSPIVSEDTLNVTPQSSSRQHNKVLKAMFPNDPKDSSTSNEEWPRQEKTQNQFLQAQTPTTRAAQSDLMPPPSPEMTPFTPRTVPYFSQSEDSQTEPSISTSTDSFMTMSTVSAIIDPKQVMDPSVSRQQVALVSSPLIQIAPASESYPSSHPSHTEEVSAHSDPPSSFGVDSISVAVRTEAQSASTFDTENRQEIKLQNIAHSSPKITSPQLPSKKQSPHSQPQPSPLSSPRVNSSGTHAQKESAVASPLKEMVAIPKLDVKRMKPMHTTSPNSPEQHDNTPGTVLSMDLPELKSPHRSASQQVDAQFVPVKTKERTEEPLDSSQDGSEPPAVQVTKLSAPSQTTLEPLKLEDLPEHGEAANEVFSARSFATSLSHSSRSVKDQKEELDRMELQWKSVSQEQQKRLDEMQKQRELLEKQLQSKEYKADSPAEDLKRILKDLQENPPRNDEDDYDNSRDDRIDVEVSKISMRQNMVSTSVDQHISPLTAKLSQSKSKTSPVADRDYMHRIPPPSSYFTPTDVSHLKEQYNRFVSVGVQAQRAEPLLNRFGDEEPISVDRASNGRLLFINRIPRQTSSARESRYKGREELEALFGRSVKYSEDLQVGEESPLESESNKKSSRSKSSQKRKEKSSSSRVQHKQNSKGMITTLTSPLQDKKREVQRRIEKKFEQHKLAHLKQLMLFQIKLLDTTPRHIFKKMDKDNSGLLSKHEFTEGMKEYLCIDGNWEALFNSIDSGNTGMIEFEDLDKSLREQYRMMLIKSKILTLTDKFTLENIFEMWSYDKGKRNRNSVLGVTHATTLKYEQFRRGIQQSRVGAAPSEISLLFGSIDVRAVGRITFDEFSAAFSDFIMLADNMESLRAYRQRLKSVMHLKRLSFKQLFDIFDLDNNGILDFFEFRKNMQDLCKVEESASSDLLLRTLFNMMDVNGDGEVEFSEFECSLTAASREDAQYGVADAFRHFDTAGVSETEVEHHSDILPIHEPDASWGNDPIVSAILNGLHDDEPTTGEESIPGDLISSLMDEEISRVGRAPQPVKPEETSRPLLSNFLSQTVRDIQSSYYQPSFDRDTPPSKKKSKGAKKSAKKKKTAPRIRDFEPDDKIIELDGSEAPSMIAAKERPTLHSNRNQARFLNNFFS